MFNSDKPIKIDKEDKLNRLEFIQNLAIALNNYDESDCLVIGLIGEWGSGKTSILNLVINGINEKYEVFRYEPWIFSEENNLIFMFFNELLKNLKEIEKNNENCEFLETFKETTDSLKNFAKKLLDNSTTSANITVSDGLKTISFGGSFSPNFDDETLEESLENLKEKINEGLEKLDKKILIIIDDIDRLSDNEVKQIFKLVKTVADFNNIVYILSFDKKMILKSLDKVQTYSSEKYLEKIVQIQIEVPKIDITKLQYYFEEELIETLNNNKIELEDEDFITILYYLKPFISNIRDIKRFKNHLIFHLPFLKYEVNISDYLIILALQLFENEIYNEIKNNKQFFVGTNSFDRNEKELIEKNLNEIINKNKKINGNIIKNIVAHLFPRLYGDRGDDWLRSWRYELRVCHPDYFDKYFTLSIPETEISQLELNILFNYENYEQIKNKAFEFDKEGKSRELIEDIIHFHEKIPNKNIKNFLKLIIENGDELNIAYKGFSYNESYLTSKIISELLKKLDYAERYELLKKIIINLNENIFTIIAFLNMEKNTIEKHKNKQNSEEYTILTLEEIEELDKIILEKIKMLCVEKQLLNCYNLDVILDYWSSIDNEEIVSEFFESCLINDENIIKIIQGFETKTSSQNLSEPFSRIHTKFTFSIMEKFINLEEFKNTILSMHNEDNKYLDYFIGELESYINKYPPKS